MLLMSVLMKKGSSMTEVAIIHGTVMNMNAKNQMKNQMNLEKIIKF